MSPQICETVSAPFSTIFRLAAEVELWPALLPHIRSLRVLRRDGSRRAIEVSLIRRFLWLSWIAVQRIEPDRGRVTFLHVDGLTRGLLEDWQFTPIDAARIEVAVSQRLRVTGSHLYRPRICSILGRLILAPATAQTLERLRLVAEGGPLVDWRPSSARRGRRR